ncbi:hypothetical protein [Niveispirillum lacus]|nr:hypothetical protein [Niveispirillum lacus]
MKVRRKSMVSVFISAFVVLVCAQNIQAEKQTATTITHLLSSSETAHLSRLAAEGDPKAAFRLGLDAEEREAPIEEQIFWMQIAQENGHPYAMSGLSAMYYRKGGEFACIRSLYWLKKFHNAEIERDKKYDDLERRNREKFVESADKCK